MSQIKTTVGLLSISIQKPVAITMFFIAVAMLGLFSWYRLPVELVPALSGDKLFVNYYRPGAEPEVLEREILIPLESRIARLPGVTETSGEISGSNGTLRIEFEPGSNYRIRELELRQIAAEISQTQPEGTRINVASQDSALLSHFVMSVQILSEWDSSTLREIAEKQIKPRVAAVEGVSQVFVFGGTSKEVAITIYAVRCAELGVNMSQVASSLRQSVKGLQYLGNADNDNRDIAVILDARPGSEMDLGEIRITPDLPVLLRHVADIKVTRAPQLRVSRINGLPSVNFVIFQDKGANLVQLGRNMRQRVAELKQEFEPFGLDFVISFDAAETVDEQLGRLQTLAASGFIIALLVLFLFLKELRAVAVVAIAVPVSLLAAGALLYLGGYSLNLITLFGLVIGIGMLVDNSIVVYEAVQRRLEKGIDAHRAAHSGISKTIRAILTSSATNAVVFLPLIYFDQIPLTVRQILENLVPAILFPLASSLLVAIALVPLLAQRLAAPAAQQRIKRNAQRRREFEGKVPPQLEKELFSALLKVALRRPSPWILGIFFTIFATLVIAMPWVLVQSLSQQAEESSEIRVEVEFDDGGSLDTAGHVFDRLEASVKDIAAIQRTESHFQEDQGSVTVYLKDNAPKGSATNIRRAINSAVEGIGRVQIRPIRSAAAGAEDEGIFGGNASKIAISGQDMAELARIANSIKEKLQQLPEISSATISSKQGDEEIEVRANTSGIAARQLWPEEVFSLIFAIGREGEQLPLGFDMPDGREIPLMLRREIPEGQHVKERLLRLPAATQKGVITLEELASVYQGVPPYVISHHNGRREINVEYLLDDKTPTTGPRRIALEKEIGNIVKGSFLPEGYTIETGNDEATNWFQLIVIPILFLLYAVLAISFESFTLPLLILIAVPLTVLGSIWALFIAGMGVDMMAGVGVIVLLGLTVNPAILLVDRMQQKRLNSHCSGGTAAMTAVRERVRPVLMTSCTSIAGLWPLALATGTDLEIWPPFATVVIGGLATSTVLTLLVIPIGFVALNKVDRILAGVGAWPIMLWIALSVLSVFPLIQSGLIDSYSLQVICTLGIATLYLWLIVNIIAKRSSDKPKQAQSNEANNVTNIAIETRYLSKVYGQAGPVGEAWNKWLKFSRRFTTQNIRELKDQCLSLSLVFSAATYLAIQLQSMFWRVIFTYLAAALLNQLLINLARLLKQTKKSTEIHVSNKVDPNESAAGKIMKLMMPWFVFVYLISVNTIMPAINEDLQDLRPVTAVILGLLILFIQQGRLKARSIASGNYSLKVENGAFKSLRSRWRALCHICFSFGMQRETHCALSSIHFRAETGMIGILGPNGAGKTTLLRLLASILEPTHGTVHYADTEKRKLGNKFAQYIGYLPQEFGLPSHLTGREYLTYFALLHGFIKQQDRNLQIDKLIAEVGLQEKQNEKISNYSGGMRQRLAIARTLLHEPPIIIVDEPTVGLDPRERIRLRNLLSKLSANRVVLFSTHVVEDVAVSCNRVIVIKKGSIVYDGNPQELADQANGKTWQLNIAETELTEFEENNKVITQVPEIGGQVNLRVLSHKQPHFNAEPVDANLEDGYLELLYGEEA